MGKATTTVYYFIHLFPKERKKIFTHINEYRLSSSFLPEIFSHRKKEDILLRRSAYTDFDETIRKLNETMGLCIK